MSDRVPPIAPAFPHFLHGGDFNPEQWIRTPEVWDQDMKLLKLAHCNAVTVGIFSWAMLEPEEGKFDFGWLDAIAEKIAKNGIRLTLATPGGAKPAWMALKYPQTLRVDKFGRRQLWGNRHNHCFTSPVFREKAASINEKLATRYKDHPTLTLWHVNNEYSEDCHCDLCSAAFRDWLKERYQNDLDKLNAAWWSNFWSHTITDFEQVNPPSPIGETQVHGQNLDWLRFVTDQTIACFRAEAEPLRRLTPNIPITTNFMTFYSGLNYYKFAKELDVVSWDSYPDYHDRPTDWLNAVSISFVHSQRRAMKHKPFILMEMSPGVQNYKPVNKLKRPGLHAVEALQAVAHGSDSVLYFQWRKSRGGIEKFHGAVVDHFPNPDARVFREVAQLGQTLEKLDPVIGTNAKAEVAIIFDYENRWAFDDTLGPRNEKKNYPETCVEHYRPFWSAGVNVDVIAEDDDFTPYKLLIAPLLYMIRPGVAERIEQFVATGGVFVTTYLSGIANESDLCFQNGFPGPLRKVTGVWAEEIDALYDKEIVPIVAAEGNEAGLTGRYEGGILADLLHTDSATILATYGGEFYEGRPAVTVNEFGEGRAYYVASRNDARFHGDFFKHLIDTLKLKRALNQTLPDGITAATRTDGQYDYVFLLSFAREAHKIDLGKAEFQDLLTGEKVTGSIQLASYTSRILKRPIKA